MSTRFHLSIPNYDENSVAFIKAQKNPSQSVRLLIQGFLASEKMRGLEIEDVCTLDLFDLIEKSGNMDAISEAASERHNRKSVPAYEDENGYDDDPEDYEGRDESPNDEVITVPVEPEQPEGTEAPLEPADDIPDGIDEPAPEEPAVSEPSGVLDDLPGDTLGDIPDSEPDETKPDIPETPDSVRKVNNEAEAIDRRSGVLTKDERNQLDNGQLATDDDLDAMFGDVGGV